jgi:hypothetical protein
LWGTSGRIILRRKNGAWQRLASFPFAWPRDLFGVSRLTSRAARADKCNLYVNAAGNVLTIRAGQVYVLRENSLLPIFRVQGDCVLHCGLCEDEQGWTYFGEYFMNPERVPVRIWRVNPALDEWETAYEFREKLVRHVHGVFRDPYDAPALWATLGDAAGECGILRSRDRFRTVEWFGDGSQVWRAVNLFFTPDYICWLTDSPLEPSHACRMDRRNGALEIGQPLECSGWYGSTTAEGLHVAFTTVEPGPAIRRSESSVLVSRDAFHWIEAASFKKDFYRPMQVFKFGVISVPSGQMSQEEFYLSGEGLVGLDGLSLRVRIAKKGMQL